MLRLLTFCLLLLLHPVHVSITNIEYISEIRAFKVFIRMYFDDFLLDSKLNKEDFQNQSLSAYNSSSKAAVNTYIHERVIIKSDGVQLSAKLKDIKLTDNEINIYLDYPVEKMPEKVSVNNSVMTGLYSDQSNMIILKVRNFEEGMKLNSEVAEHTFLIN
jgi:hypothetical protein